MRGGEAAAVAMAQAAATSATATVNAAARSRGAWVGEPPGVEVEEAKVTYIDRSPDDP